MATAINKCPDCGSEATHINAAFCISALRAKNTALTERIERLRTEMIRLRDCDWVITLPDRMDAVREIARNAIADDDKENL